MTVTSDTVDGRIGRIGIEPTPTQLAVIVALVAAIGSALLFVQEPLVHDALHNFRHVMGVTCH